MKPGDLQVLNDFLLERMSPDQAAFVLKVASHPKQAQVLFDLPLASTCPCGMDREFGYEESMTHMAHCKVVAALQALKDPRFETVIDQARWAAQQEDTERTFEQQQTAEQDQRAEEYRRENQRRMRARQPVAATHSSHIPTEDLAELEPEPATSSYFDDE
jgi:hypothetical protein